MYSEHPVSDMSEGITKEELCEWIIRNAYYIYIYQRNLLDK